MIGIIKLQHMEGVSDEEVVTHWVQNPYWQYFCGYDHLQWGFPIDPSSLTHWRQRLGEDGLERILSSTIQCALATGTVKQKDLERVIVDTTVMEKNITHPTDSKLLYRTLAKLVEKAKSNSVSLRQSYVRVSKNAFHQAGRYAHAKQFKRMKREVKRLKS